MLDIMCTIQHAQMFSSKTLRAQVILDGMERRPYPVNAGSAPDGPCFVGCRPHPLGAKPQTPLHLWGLGPMAPRRERGAGCNPASRDLPSPAEAGLRAVGRFCPQAGAASLL